MPLFKKKKEDEPAPTPVPFPPSSRAAFPPDAAPPTSSAPAPLRTAPPTDWISCPKCTTPFDGATGVCPQCHRTISAAEVMLLKTIGQGGSGAPPPTGDAAGRPTRSSATAAPGALIKCRRCQFAFAPTGPGPCPLCGEKTPQG